MILGRTLDKCRALLAGNIGEYHFDCPLDNMLFGWKGVTGDDFKAEVEKGASDDEMAKWVDAHGTPKTENEKRAWCDEMLTVNPYENPEKREWYEEQLRPLGLEPGDDSALRLAREGRQSELPKGSLSERELQLATASETRPFCFPVTTSVRRVPGAASAAGETPPWAFR